jgi:hypothetical protein
MEAVERLSEFEEAELANEEVGIIGQKGRLHLFLGRHEWPKFLSEVAKARGGTVSRTEAAMLLRCSRQRIHQLVQEGHLECWEFQGGWLRSVMMYSEISVLDLLSYGELNKLPVEEFHAMKLVDWNEEIQKWFNDRKPLERSPVKIQTIEFKFLPTVWYDTRDGILAMPPYATRTSYGVDPVSHREPLDASYHANLRTINDAARALERLRGIPEIDQTSFKYSIFDGEIKPKDLSYLIAPRATTRSVVITSDRGN